MAINLKQLNQSGVRGWGPTLALTLVSEAKKLGNASGAGLNTFDLTALKKSISQFEELRDRAKELGINIYRNKII